jgi:RNA polymerase sigma factor (sigma-70 family)
MTDHRPAAGLANLRRQLLAPDGAGLTDGQLLELFVTLRDGAAFEALVRRHGPMVLGVCRRVTRHWQDAEDAFQAAFLVLAKKAGSVTPPGRVGNWLYGVAYRTALKARAQAVRRATRERPVEEVPEPMAEPPGWNDLAPLLDAELNRLPALYRLPVVLCDLEDRPRTEVARQLGIPEGTLSSRLTAARRKLAARLTRRGFTVSAAALASTLAAGAAADAEVPRALLGATVRGGLLVAAGQALGGAIPASVAVLAGHTLRALAVGRLTVAVVLTALVAAAAAVGITVATSGKPTSASPPAQAVAAPPPVDPRSVPGPTGLRTQVERTEWVLSAVHAERRVVSLTDRPDLPRENGLAVVNGPKGLGPAGVALDDLTVAADATVQLDGRPAALSDLRPDMRVGLRLAVDRLVATRVEARSPKPPPVACVIAAVDPVRGTLAVTVTGTDVRMDELVLTPETRIDVVRLRAEQPVVLRAGRVADLKVGAAVALDLAVSDAGAVHVRRLQVGE